MHLILKITLTVVVVLTATFAAKFKPSLAGLIGVMPLTGLMVMIWVYFESNANTDRMAAFSIGAVLGIIPTILFFISAFILFKRDFKLWSVILLSFAVWLVGAFLHQWFFRK